jgi:hypothetical protein
MDEPEYQNTKGVARLFSSSHEVSSYVHATKILASLLYITKYDKNLDILDIQRSGIRHRCGTGAGTCCS